MVCRWPEGNVELFETLYEYFGLMFIPHNFVASNLVTSFYTDSLTLVLKVMKMDFMFQYNRNMFSLDILLNDKTTTECFGDKITIDEVVTKIINQRFNEHRELNLTNFCNDPVLHERKIHFHKLVLLAHFKILMLRMGKETRILNLSSNNLSQVPSEILNFFIKGDLIGVNLSNNNIPSLAELQRISSKIEKLWVEGNPLCGDILDAVTYIRQISQKFPRLTELDGVPLNNHGVKMPFFKHHVNDLGNKTKLVIEKFVTLYFGHYDTNRLKLENFYVPHANFTITTDFKETAEDILKDPYARHSRNFINPVKRAMYVEKNKKRSYHSQQAVITVLNCLPPTEHDLSTFRIDVLQHDSKCLVFVIDGVYKELPHRLSKERFIHFRRTFILYYAVKPYNNMLTSYVIVHEMFSASLASPEIVRNSFKFPIRNICQIKLIEPDTEDVQTMCNIFIYYTKLKKSEAKARLIKVDWDIKKALKQFTYDLKSGAIHSDKFIEDDDFSDLSSLLEDELD
ncbi:nuclear RNA export factor 2 isoform X2 [Bicyclus anynana]|uniref:Nuclear RNA export factor 2 isoform X2 n=1 Tax=Bicyclus anynana TaxID=110368 RepID=A0ABM3LZ26_BICAN|nr:nuclear RNA export factor 2 isoform X2 [Bicyclus anynana]